MRRLLLISALGVIMLIAMVLMAAGLTRLPDAGAGVGFMGTSFAAIGLYWGLGALIVGRANGHVVGWLFAVAAAIMASASACYFLGFVLASSQPRVPLGEWFALVASLLFPVAIILALPAVALTFPTGTLPGPRWRWPVRLVVAMVAVRMLAIVIRPGPIVNGGPDNPLTPWLPALSPSVLQILGALDAIGSLSILLGAGLGVAAIIVRFRRSRGDQRQQLKWFLAAMAPAVVLLPIASSEVGVRFPLINLLSVATVPIVAMSVAIAILRYRLYDIDRLIARTVSWAVVTGVLLSIFAGGVVALQALLARFTSGQTLAVAASTLVAFALFQPLRRRVQSVVDRRFDRARYDAQRTAAEFSDRMRDELDLADVSGDLDATIRGAIAPRSIGIWLRESRR